MCSCQWAHSGRGLREICCQIARRVRAAYSNRTSPLPSTTKKEPRMIKPYTAVGLIPTVRGVRKREDIAVNLEHLTHLTRAAAWLSSLDLPVRLIALPEG